MKFIVWVIVISLIVLSCEVMLSCSQNYTILFNYRMFPIGYNQILNHCYQGQKWILAFISNNTNLIVCDCLDWMDYNSFLVCNKEFSSYIIDYINGDLVTKLYQDANCNTLIKVIEGNLTNSICPQEASYVRL